MSGEESRLVRVKRFFSSDGPAFTDYPRTDIRANRSIARLMTVMAVVMLLGGWYYGSTGDIAKMGVGVGMSGLIYASGQSLRLQALEWEVQLDDD